ncbi:MAG: LysR family transcriptional regulator [Magnetococcales bacterium]|nr:LysR family transcriptional regulator [Magnetococcales bacterium]
MSFCDTRLSVFYAVAKHLSFTRAAEELEQTQPAITFQIRQLEEHFNTRLFERHHNRVSLTEAGSRAFQYAGRILDLYRETEKKINVMTGHARGEFRLGATTTPGGYLVPGILCRYHDLFPGVKVRLSLHNTGMVLRKLEDVTIDIGMVEGPVNVDNVDVVPCMTDELVVIMPPHHPLATLPEISVTHLPKYPFISREEGSGTRAVIAEFLQRFGIHYGEMNINLEVGTTESIKSAVEAGIGFSIVSRMTLRKEKLLKLVEIRHFQEGVLSRPINLVIDKHRTTSKATDDFVRFVQSQCDDISGNKVAR